MNRTGLTVALAVAAVVGLAFGIYPELDLRLSRPFFEKMYGDFPFGLRFDPVVMALREGSMWLVALLVAPAVVALVAKLALPGGRLRVPGRAVLFLLATLALGPGLLVNVVLKEHWHRSRPIDVAQFGGAERFVPWWDTGGNCPTNCSFVSGDVSGVAWTLAVAALAPPGWRALAYGGALAFTAGISVLRMAAGGHFFTDVTFAAVFTFLVIWLCYGLIYRWRRTRLSDDAVERALERAALPPHDAVLGWFGRRR
jgi:lipid A 4'-phosphatase